jgi:AraC-like DNA-binding protein
MLTPDEQLRFDAAGSGLFRAVHRASLEEVMSDLRLLRTRAVVVSTAFCRYSADASRMARMVREFPQVPTVALISELDRGTARAVLTLGQCGIRTLVDVREPSGWRELRAMLAGDSATEFRQLVLATLLGDLPGVRPGCKRFFEVVFATAPRVGTIRDLAGALQVLPSTLMSRFYRARLPAPRRILSYARLMYAARLFENPGLSVANVALQLDYSSGQSFSRHLRTALGLSAQTFRSRYDGRGMLQRFRDDLILSCRDAWHRFDPLEIARGGRPPRESRLTPVLPLGRG